MNPPRRAAALLAKYAAITAAAFLIIVSRRPQAIFQPQFWAEDGKVWYAQAYNNGFLYSLFTQEAGYFQSFPRLVAGISQCFSLESAPIFFNLSAIAVQIIVVCFFVSSRFASVVPSTAARFAIAFVYLAMPHSYEVYANVTNSQWHLALLCFLVIAATVSEKIYWRIFDVVVCVLSVLSGPFCMFLVPVAALKLWKKRERWTLVLLSILIAGSVLQTISIMIHPRPTQAPLGASVSTFFEITSRHLFLSPLIGGYGYAALLRHVEHLSPVTLLSNLLGILILGYAFYHGKTEVRLLIIFSILIVSAALVSPAVSLTDPQWPAIASNETALRYWFVPSICLYVCLISLLTTSQSKVIIGLAAAILCLGSTGMINDWANPKFPDRGFAERARDFERAAPGTAFVIPINPDWEMTLVKR